MLIFFLSYLSFPSDSQNYCIFLQHNLRGAHIIKLGSGNDDAAKEALRTWPRAFQLGGGITIDNAAQWLDAGAEKVFDFLNFFGHKIRQYTYNRFLFPILFSCILASLLLSVCVNMLT